MSKRATRMFVLFGLLFMALLSVNVVRSSSTLKSFSEIVVPDQYSTIQEAINNAVDGDSIFVRAGTYYEHVVIGKAVSLVGEDRSATIVDGGGTGYVMSILCDNVSVTGFTIQRGQFGIYVLNSKYVSILNNIVRHNYGTDWDAGIRLEYADYTTIHDNMITDNWRGVLLYAFSPYVSVYGNNVTSNEYGIRVAMGGSSYVNISGNYVANNRGYGIDVTGFGGEAQSNYATIAKNLIVNNTYEAVGLGEGSNYNTVIQNSMVGNGHAGVTLERYSNNNTVVKNDIIGNAYGICFDLFTVNSTQNTIFNNNIINNTQQVRIVSGSVNAWNGSYPCGGNYWSDYVGLDQFSGPYQNVTGSDGIGDTPYVIDANNTDNYPLIDLWSSDGCDWIVDDDGPADFDTIQGAINGAFDGDSIFVRAGTYFEHVTVGKCLTLLGEGREVTVIDGNLTGNVVTVTQDYVNIRGFTIQRSGRDYTNSGIYVGSTRYCDISANYIVDNEYGVHGSPRNMSVTDNTIERNFFGVDLQSGSTGNVISRNHLVANYVSVHLNLADANCILQNNMTNNWGSVTLWDSKNNEVYHNNFFNTFGSVTYANFLDNGFEGNYWSNYTGVDLNHDGIGDTPHVISANNTDHYPLMGMFSSFNTSYEYAVNFASNSSISSVSFDLSYIEANPEEAMLAFNVSGNTGTEGFVRVCIPKILINRSYVVRFNDEIITNTTYPRARELPCSNETYTYFYINYTHSEHTITITETSACAHGSVVVPDDFATIQDAINNAVDGDTVFVKAGTYYEHVVVNKSLSIFGENRENTLIDGNKTGPVILVAANGVNLTEFTIQAGQNSHPICNVWLENVSKCNIHGNILKYSFYGVYLDESNGNGVYENFATNVSIGICGFCSDWNSVFRNEFVANSFAGINFHLCSFNNITENLISGNSVGMRLLDGANNNTIRHNNFVNNTVQVYVQSSYNNIWNDGYPSGGNYWSDYGGVDLYGGLYQNEVGSDGVGDTPYAIDANNMDRWPLMTQWIELLADINHDRIVNISDAVMLAGVFGTVPTSLNWNPDADLNSDNAVDIFDAIILANNFGRTI